MDSNWWMQKWPMKYLKEHLRWQLANSLDVTTTTGLGYPTFAAQLFIGDSRAYLSEQIDLIRARSRDSATISLLQDYERRGGTIQGVQFALEMIRHVAQTYIPAYFQSEEGAQLRRNLEQLPPYTRGYYGYQQTELSMCNCPQCQHPNHTPANSSVESSRQDLIRRQRSMPSDRISASVNRIRYTSEPQGTEYTGSVSSVTSSTTQAGESTTQNYGFQSPSVNTMIQNQWFQVSSMPLNAGNTGLRPSGSINREKSYCVCDCEKCRLESDPDQTQRLTLGSDHKVPCRLLQGNTRPENMDQGQRLGDSSLHNSEIASRPSQLYLDSDNTTETENSDETFLKDVSDPGSQQISETKATAGIKQTEQDSANDIRRLCARSDNGQHRLGDKIASCPVCKRYAGAIPKKGQRPRNSSTPQKTEETETDLRRSWHGSQEHETNENLRKILSDSVLSVSSARSSGESNTQSSENSIEATMLVRISSGSRSSSETNARLNSTNSSGSGESYLDGEIYQNNLDSGNTRLLVEQQACSRNIVQSDSSNCSGQQPTQEHVSSYPQNTVQNEIHNQNRDTITLESVPRGSLYAASARSDGDMRAGNINRESRDSDRTYLSCDRPGSNNRRESESSVDFERRVGDSNLGARARDRMSGDCESRSGDFQSGDFVLVTFSWNGNTDREEFIQDVITFCKKLRESGIRVKIDMDESSYASLRLNKLDWIDRNVREAKYVIVCITPTYATDTREPDPRVQAAPRSSQLNARYIFDKLREEYYRNHSQNRRVIPVMFSDYETEFEHVPECMRSTLIYSYPNSVRQIVQAILGVGVFHPNELP